MDPLSWLLKSWIPFIWIRTHFKRHTLQKISGVVNTPWVCHLRTICRTYDLIQLRYWQKWQDERCNSYWAGNERSCSAVNRPSVQCNNTKDVIQLVFNKLQSEGYIGENSTFILCEMASGNIQCNIVLANGKNVLRLKKYFMGNLSRIHFLSAELFQVWDVINFYDLVYRLTDVTCEICPLLPRSACIRTQEKN